MTYYKYHDYIVHTSLKTFKYVTVMKCNVVLYISQISSEYIELINNDTK